MKLTSPKTVLCIHDLSALGRAGLSAILPVLAMGGMQAVALPTALLSSHTGGLGTPAVIKDASYGDAALDQYRDLGIVFNFIYSGYLATPEQADLVRRAHSLWPDAFLLVDPVLGDGGKLYSGFNEDSVERLRTLCAEADLILPNFTEAGFLTGETLTLPADYAEAMTLAEQVRAAVGAKAAVITGMSVGKYIVCAGAGRDSFYVAKQHLNRSFPGTGDLFGAILLSCLGRGNALSAAADAAASFVAEAILATAPEADTRMGVWYEPLLSRPTPGGIF